MRLRAIATDRRSMPPTPGRARMGIDTPEPRADRVRPGLPPHRWTRVDEPGEVAVVASHDTVIAGAGPAGLTAAYELTRHGGSCVVLEAEARLGRGGRRAGREKGGRG